MPDFREDLTVGDGNFTAFTAHTKITVDKVVEVFSSSQGGIGIVSENIGGGIAVKGVCLDGTGVQGESGNGRGFLAGRDPIFNQTAGVFGQTDQSGVFGNSEGPGGTGVYGRAGAGGGFGVRGEIVGSGAAAIKGQVFGSGNALAGQFVGNVEITGNLNLSSPTSDIVLADVAEGFHTRDSEVIEPGTVVVLDEHGYVCPGREAYDKKVAGVVSGAGHFRAAIILGEQALNSSDLQVALMGKVCCKVDATFAPIEVGDLLTTSITVGHAMKAADPLMAFGTVIGKALAPLKTGRDLIPILVALQ